MCCRRFSFLDDFIIGTNFIFLSVPIAKLPLENIKNSVIISLPIGTGKDDDVLSEFLRVPVPESNK